MLSEWHSVTIDGKLGEVRTIQAIWETVFAVDPLKQRFLVYITNVPPVEQHLNKIKTFITKKIYW